MALPVKHKVVEILAVVSYDHNTSNSVYANIQDKGNVINVALSKYNSYLNGEQLCEFELFLTYFIRACKSSFINSDWIILFSNYLLWSRLGYTQEHWHISDQCHQGILCMSDIYAGLSWTSSSINPWDS